uniref:Uncharacterized protein n=1 Tax=Sus scrofa TaxID=9823 RepID=A0A4X1TEG3_PIG
MVACFFQLKIIPKIYQLTNDKVSALSQMPSPPARNKSDALKRPTYTTSSYQPAPEVRLHSHPLSHPSS